MGVDYYECDGCDFGFRDDSEFCCWCECGAKFHNNKCGGLKNYCRWNEEIQNNRIDPDQDITCKICRKEAYNDKVLLEALLKHFNLTKERAAEIYRQQ